MEPKLPDSAHFARAWRIHEIAPDFRLLDVWALPTPGGPDDFQRLVGLLASTDLTRGSTVVRALFAIRWAAGRLLRLDRPATVPGEARTLRGRLPADLRPAGAAPRVPHFSSLYLIGDEWALEIINRTVHGVLHLGWAPDGEGAYRGQMAVLVKPNGRFGTIYLAAIGPFRHRLVYPAMARAAGQAWRAGR